MNVISSEVINDLEIYIFILFIVLYRLINIINITLNVCLRYLNCNIIHITSYNTLKI